MNILMWEASFGPNFHFEMKKPHEKYILLAAINIFMKTAFLAFAGLRRTFWIIF